MMNRSSIAPFLTPFTENGASLFRSEGFKPGKLNMDLMKKMI
jgi:hypothetical protein